MTKLATERARVARLAEALRLARPHVVSCAEFDRITALRHRDDGFHGLAQMNEQARETRLAALAVIDDALASILEDAA